MRCRIGRLDDLSTASNFVLSRPVASRSFVECWRARPVAAARGAPLVATAARRADRPHSRCRQTTLIGTTPDLRDVEVGGVRTLLVVPLRKDNSAAGHHCRLSPGGAAVLRQADRAVAELRGAGGHCDGERAADHRDARGLGAADRDRRGVAGHQFLARRPRPRLRRDARQGNTALRGGAWSSSYLRRRMLSSSRRQR